MVNYKEIADNDPGGVLEVAFNAMSLEIISTTPEVMITYRRISASVDLQSSLELETAVLASMPKWVNQALAFDGININDPQVSSVLTALIGEISASKIISMGVIKTPKYTGFKIGHLANARQKRAEGKI